MHAAGPVINACKVDAAACDVITKAGYGELFVLRTGLSLLTEVQTPPYITASSQTVLGNGIAFSIEPGIYLSDRFGLQLEEIVIKRSDGLEILSDLPRDVRRLQSIQTFRGSFCSSSVGDVTHQDTHLKGGWMRLREVQRRIFAVSGL